MPRVTHVKRAQQRYETKPVIDPATGEQKVVPVMSSRTGEQKKSKSGRPVFLRVTERDLDRPKPMPQCDYPECKHETREIKVGESYKWIEPSGQRVRNRHADCPSWQVWEYSSSLSARIAQITNEDPEGETVEDFEAWAANKAEEIRGLAEEKRESASNIEEGFGHATYQSEELEQTADDLESWADKLEGVDIPAYPEPEETECDECGGSGKCQCEANPCTAECEACDGKGQITPDEPTDEQIADWEQESSDAIRNILDEAPY
jgi:hypothetical protein